MREIAKVVSRYIVAAVFIFSGFVKCVDPTGTAIKFEEYFTAFGTDFLIPLSMVFSILMCGIELLAGIMLLLNLRIQTAIWTSVALMALYTPLTLWLAISNKITDCGCFGDALVLTNWETFWKNIILDGFLVVMLLNRKRYKDLVSSKVQLILTVGAGILVGAFEWYNLSHLPVIDFMPYKVGANIPEGMTVPEADPEANPPVLVYKKDGKLKEFTLENYPKDDTTWVWVETRIDESALNQVPLIHDFNIWTTDGQDVTDMILSDPGYSLFVIINSLKNANLTHMDDINQLVERAISKGYKVYGLTSSLPEEFEAFKEKVKATYPMYMMDGTTLKTMIRSNPGLLLLKEGTVMGKWHHRQVKRIKTI